jgi:diguanylate cyclase (GGDEF)-like protein
MTEQIIELGISKRFPPPHERASNAWAVWLTENLLALIQELPLDNEALQAGDFRPQLESLHQVLRGPSKDDEKQEAAQKCLALCQDFAAHATTYFFDREAEFDQIMQVLRNALMELSGEASKFQDQLASSSERMSQLSAINDIRQLKMLLAAEVDELKRNISEKQRKDDEVQQELSEQIQSLQTNLTIAQAEASLDPLTGVANRRSFDLEIKRCVAEYREHGKPFSLAMFDLDDFKQINDTYGHQVGDFFLQSAAQSLTSSVRGTDFVARYGGEEFVVILKGCKLAQAETKLSSIVEIIASSTFDYQSDDLKLSLSFTASCGVAECGARESTANLMMRADEALYEAKRRGKNCVVSTW